LRDLRDFLKILEEKGELARISLSVSPELEISEITQRVSKGPKDLNKALLFENAKESNIPVVTNLFGTHKRMALALGVKDLKELEKKAQGLLGLFSAKTFGDFFRAGKGGSALLLELCTSAQAPQGSSLSGDHQKRR
jgi:UbiD family decarboxylase